MRFRIGVGLSIAALMMSLPAALEANGSCGDNGYGANCEVLNTGAGVEVDASETQPGSEERDPAAPGVELDDPSHSAPPPASAEPCVVSIPEGRLCRGNYLVVGLPDVTLSDLASFVPAKPSLTGEPAGIGVVGMSTNIVAAASEQIMAGRLFEYDVRVRFVPAAYRFDYGDGTAATTTGGGASWSALGQAEFSPTSTSHVYTARGTYTASVTVLYSAAVDFGSGAWRPVAGFVEATTGGYGIRVVEVHTALVDKTCIENPAGPGC